MFIDARTVAGWRGQDARCTGHGRRPLHDSTVLPSFPEIREIREMREGNALDDGFSEAVSAKLRHLRGQAFGRPAQAAAERL